MSAQQPDDTDAVVAASQVRAALAQELAATSKALAASRTKLREHLEKVKAIVTLALDEGISHDFTSAAASVDFHAQDVAVYEERLARLKLQSQMAEDLFAARCRIVRILRGDGPPPGFKNYKQQYAELSPEKRAKVDRGVAELTARHHEAEAAAAKTKTAAEVYAGLRPSGRKLLRDLCQHNRMTGIDSRTRRRWEELGLVVVHWGSSKRSCHCEVTPFAREVDALRSKDEARS